MNPHVYKRIHLREVAALPRMLRSAHRQPDVVAKTEKDCPDIVTETIFQFKKDKADFRNPPYDSHTVEMGNNKKSFSTAIPAVVDRCLQHIPSHHQNKNTLGRCILPTFCTSPRFSQVLPLRSWANHPWCHPPHLAWECTTTNELHQLSTCKSDILRGWQPLSAEMMRLCVQSHQRDLFSLTNQARVQAAKHR
jgi:hypothetical protein